MTSCFSWHSWWRRTVQRQRSGSPEPEQFPLPESRAPEMSALVDVALMVVMKATCSLKSNGATTQRENKQVRFTAQGKRPETLRDGVRFVYRHRRWKLQFLLSHHEDWHSTWDRCIQWSRPGERPGGSAWCTKVSHMVWNLDLFIPPSQCVWVNFGRSQESGQTWILVLVAHISWARLEMVCDQWRAQSAPNLVLTSRC